jgi:hypothetical protein
LQTLSRVVKICVQSQWAKTKIENWTKDHVAPSSQNCKTTFLESYFLLKVRLGGFNILKCPNEPFKSVCKVNEKNNRKSNKIYMMMSLLHNVKITTKYLNFWQNWVFVVIFSISSKYASSQTLNPIWVLIN